MGVILAKKNPDFRFLPGFSEFSHFIDTAPLLHSDLLPSDQARNFLLEGKTESSRQKAFPNAGGGQHRKSLLWVFEFKHRFAELNFHKISRFIKIKEIETSPSTPIDFPGNATLLPRNDHIHTINGDFGHLFAYFDANIATV